MSEARTLYKPHFFFVAATLAPLIVVAGTLYLYYKYTENVLTIPTISEAGADLPASRMFTVGMTTAAWFTMPLYIVLNQILKLKQRMEKIYKKSRIFAMNALAALSFFSYIGIGSVTIRNDTNLHYLFGITFLVSQTLYFVMLDFNLKTVPIHHILWTFLTPVAYLVSFALGTKPILEYFGVATLSLKWLLVWRDIPSTGVMLAKRNKF